MVGLGVVATGSRDLLLFGNGLEKCRSHYGRTTRQDSAFVIQYLLGKL